jgi:hypothetical protein
VSRTIKGFWLAVIAGVLPGCFVTIVGEYESYAGVVTRNYAAAPEGAARAYEISPESDAKAFAFGGSRIHFQPSTRSDNVQAAGPLIPIFPAPGKGSDYGENQFAIWFHVIPGAASFLIFDPAEYLVSVEGSDKSLAPVEMRDCEFNAVDLSELRIFGSRQCRLLYYDITIGEVHRFTLSPATIEADEILYAFPDIYYRPETYGYVE